jgi:TatD DNase family protein
MVEQLKDENLSGIFHCFGGSVEQAKRIINLGFYLGIGGVATFKKGGLDTILPSLPLSSLVLETDSPYLAPVPHRGKRNEPAYIRLVGECVSEIMNKPVAEIQKVTTENALKVFTL